MLMTLLCTYWLPITRVENQADMVLMTCVGKPAYTDHSITTDKITYYYYLKMFLYGQMLPKRTQIKFKSTYMDKVYISIL